jgi:hypothetical protein
VSAQRYFVGLDLGMGAEPTALAVLERRRVQPEDRAEARRPAYALRHLHRFSPGTGYPAIVESVVTLLKSPPLQGSWLLIDQTAVGRAVLALVLNGLNGRVNHTWSAVIITAGHEFSNPANGELRVAKADVVGTLQVLLQTRRLLVASELPHAQLLVRELENYRPKVILPKADEIAWRDSAQDDLILAVALAGWGGERALISEGRREPHTAWRS